ncbi:Uncharacterized protein ImpI/VasC [hydrothermal vent metagenome]|uniref:Uncharacterized protein ImpI/VasC n=1 Tax=hydrothermal vent metagenome TaxID=652676 RepID=A0A3B0XIC7_9ZZZZ
MSLLITVSKAPESVTLAETSKSFDVQGGTMGRGKSNTWVLDDPERFLSTTHCQLSYESGQFYISDLSTNGTFYNGSNNPMGKGTRLPLTDGDTFILGDYEFSVSLSASAGVSPVTAPASGPFDNGPGAGGDLFGMSGGLQGGLDGFAGGSPFDGGHVSSEDSPFSTSPEETDPLKALDRMKGGGAPSDPIQGGFDGLGGTAAVQGGSGQSYQIPYDDNFDNDIGMGIDQGGSHSDGADPMQEQVSWPDSAHDQTPFNGGGIPDDWNDSDDLPGAPSTAPFAPETPPAVPDSPAGFEPPVPPPAVSPQPALRPGGAPQGKPQNTGQYIAPQAEPAPMQSHETAKVQQLELENAELQVELATLKRQLNAAQNSVGGGVAVSGDVNSGLTDAMGLQGYKLADQDILQINLLVGEVIREMTSGLMKVLGSRSAIKNEFRMNVTTIQPIENNPLKFSANIDDALENMFIKQGNAYMKPVEAVREGFNGIAEHQVAILAGMRAAFKGVIGRFDPLQLEKRFAKHNKGGIIPGSQKAKNWELYLEYFNEQAGDIDNSFQSIFGDEFVNAYEEQLQKLSFARKNKN